jgi:outer membrane protein TolC
MFPRFRCLSGILLYLIATGPAGAESASGPVAFDSADAAIEIGLRNNPGLAALRAHADAQAAMPPQAGALPDPTVSLGAINFPVDGFDRDQEPMTQLRVGVSQALPFPGKRVLQEKAAQFEAQASVKSVDEARLQLISDIRSAWWRLFYLDRALEIVGRNRDLLRQLVEIARTRYEVGEGLQQDVLLAQVERSQLLDKELQLKGARQSEAARLNALLNLPAQSPVVLPARTDTALPETLPARTLTELAERSRPMLDRLRRRLDAADTRVALARRDRLPDFTLGAAYGFRDGENADGSARDDFASVTLSMSVPLYAGRKQNRAVDQRNSERLQQRYELQQEIDRVRSAVATALSDYEQAREQARLFEAGIIPQARQTVASMRAGYQVDKVDFLNLVRSQINLYNHEIRYWQSLSDAHQALARLTAAVGREVTHE